MPPPPSPDIPVIDFRRQRVVLQWHLLDGTWTACDVPPALVHGVALIRASQPTMCLYARDSKLHLQVGPEHYTLSAHSPRIRWRRGLATFGLRRRFTIESTAGSVLYSHSYWMSQGDDFFAWLAGRVADPDWRTENGHRWSVGVQPAELRAS